MSNVRNIYTDGAIIDYPEGDRSLERVSVLYTSDIGDISHTVVEGDTLQYLADRFLKDSRQWWKIADKNNLLDIFTLEVGSEIIIPNPYKL